jgi:ribosomal protein S18 acetylase RimI-like enzyme
MTWVRSKHAKACINDERTPYAFHVTDVKVAKSHRHQGHGRSLMTRIIRQATEQGKAEVTLHVELSNTPAVNLYESLGFTHAATYTSSQVSFMVLPIK